MSLTLLLRNLLSDMREGRDENRRALKERDGGGEFVEHDDNWVWLLQGMMRLTLGDRKPFLYGAVPIDVPSRWYRSPLYYHYSGYQLLC